MINSTGEHNESVVSIRDIRYGYSSTPVLEDISLDVRRGEMVGLLGPNGSGKSTLLKIVAGLIRPWRGYVRLNLKKSKIGSIGYMPQVESIDLNFPVTVEEVVAMGLWRWNRSSIIMPWSSRDARERVHRVLENLGIERYAGRQIGELSGGEQQRVFLARAIVHDPELLLLDEPTSGADTRTRDDIMDLLEELRGRTGVTVLLATHDIDGVAERLDSLVCINRYILAYGRPEEILTHDNLLRIYGFAGRGFDYEMRRKEKEQEEQAKKDSVKDAVKVDGASYG